MFLFTVGNFGSEYGAESKEGHCAGLGGQNVEHVTFLLVIASRCVWVSL